MSRTASVRIVLFDKMHHEIYHYISNLFLRTTNSRQTTLETLCQNGGNDLYFLLNEVENIAAKGELALNKQFLPLSHLLSKVLCCSGVRKRLYMGKS